MDIDLTNGKEQTCDEKPGRYVALVRPGEDTVAVNGVAVFIECNSPLLPWDPVTDLLMSIRLNETKAVTIGLATNLETALGVGVCGELKLRFTNLPTFCFLSRAQLICTPNIEERVGSHNFIIHQTSLEHPLAMKSTQVQIEVLKPVETVVVPEPVESIVVPEPFELTKNLPSEIVIRKTSTFSAWSFALPEIIAPDEDDEAEVTVDLAAAVFFVYFSSTDQILSIPDLSSASVLEGNYTDLTITLSDS